MGEQKLVVAGAIVIGVGALETSFQQKPLTPVLIGGLTFIVLLSLFSAFSPAAANLAGDMALLIAGATLLNELPTLLQQVQASQAAGTFPKTAQPQ